MWLNPSACVKDGTSSITIKNAFVFDSCAASALYMMIVFSVDDDGIGKGGIHFSALEEFCGFLGFFVKF